MESLYTVLEWQAAHRSGRDIEELIEVYWNTINHNENDEFSLNTLVELFFIVMEISTIDLEEGLFYISDLEEVLNLNSLYIPRHDLIQEINNQMKAKRSDNGSKRN